MIKDLTLEVIPYKKSLKETLETETNDKGIEFHWLGQAGFVLKTSDLIILIDPYLSNSLAEKYTGKRFSHERMMPPPISPHDFTFISLVLCTHHHTDHMDPATLRIFAENFQHLRFVVPAATADEALRRCNVDLGRIFLAKAADTFSPLDEVHITPIPSAHEQIKQNENGEHFWLGYIMEINGIKIYHSGDCIPYDGLSQVLKNYKPDIALLPVNGRDALRKENGIPGNFTLDEAVQICRKSNIKFLICHHYGLFSFNTIDPQSIDDISKTVQDIDMHAANTYSFISVSL